MHAVSSMQSTNKDRWTDSDLLTARCLITEKAARNDSLLNSIQMIKVSGMTSTHSHVQIRWPDWPIPSQGPCRNVLLQTPKPRCGRQPNLPEQGRACL